MRTTELDAMTDEQVNEHCSSGDRKHFDATIEARSDETVESSSKIT